MGGSNATRIEDDWDDLPEKEYRLAMHMALRSLDPPPPGTAQKGEPFIYRKPREAMIVAVYGRRALIGLTADEWSNRKRHVARLLKRLEGRGLVVEIKKAAPGRSPWFQLQLDRSTGDTLDVTRSDDTLEVTRLDRAEEATGDTLDVTLTGDIQMSGTGDTLDVTQRNHRNQKEEPTTSPLPQMVGSSGESADQAAFGSSETSKSISITQPTTGGGPGLGNGIEIDHEKPKAAARSAAGDDDPDHCGTCSLHHSEHTDDDLRRRGLDFHSFWPGGHVNPGRHQLTRQRQEIERAQRLKEENQRREAEEEARRKAEKDARDRRLKESRCFFCGMDEQGCRRLVGNGGHHEYTPPRSWCAVCAEKAYTCTAKKARGADDHDGHEFKTYLPGAKRVVKAPPGSRPFTPSGPVGHIEVNEDGSKVVAWDDGTRWPVADRCPDCNRHLETEGHRDTCPLGLGITTVTYDDGSEMTFGPFIPLTRPLN